MDESECHSGLDRIHLFVESRHGMIKQQLQIHLFLLFSVSLLTGSVRTYSSASGPSCLIVESSTLWPGLFLSMTPSDLDGRDLREDSSVAILLLIK